MEAEESSFICVCVFEWVRARARVWIDEGVREREREQMKYVKGEEREGERESNQGKQWGGRGL